MLKSKTMNNLFWIEVMFYSKFYIYYSTHTHIHIIYKYKKNNGKPETVHQY